MKYNKKNILGILFIFIAITSNLVFPQKAYARISFRKFFRSIRRTTRFVVNLPYKTTKFLGPTLGPIAGDIISINLGKNPKFGAFFTKARKLDKLATNIEEQNKILNDLKQIYNDKATELDQKAEQIKNMRRLLASEYVKGNITREEHLEQVADLQALAQIYEDNADRLRRSGERLNPAHVIKLLGNEFFQESIKKIKNIIETETSKELNRLFDPEVIQNIVSGTNDLEGILSVLLAGDLEKLKEDKDFNFEKFKDDLMEKIKKMLEEDKDALKENWQQKLEQLIQEQIKETKNPDVKDPTSENEPAPDLSEIKDEPFDQKCPPGYIYKRMSGVECVQKDCYEGKIPDAHLSYTGQCVCGSSGSMYENSEDPNKECAYDSSHKSCPGCVYACVHLNEECPKK